MVTINIQQYKGRSKSEFNYPAGPAAFSEGVSKLTKKIKDAQTEEEGNSYSKGLLEAEKNYILKKDKIGDDLAKTGDTEVYKEAMQTAIDESFGELSQSFSDPKKQQEVEENVFKMKNRALAQGLAQENIIIAQRDASDMRKNSEILKNTVINNPSDFNIKSTETTLVDSINNLSIDSTKKSDMISAQTDDLYFKGLSGQIANGKTQKVYDDIKGGLYKDKLSSNNTIKLMQMAKTSESVSSAAVTASVNNIATAVENGEEIRPGDLSIYKKAFAQGKVSKDKAEYASLLIQAQPIITSIPSGNKNSLDKGTINTIAGSITKNTTSKAKISKMITKSVNSWQDLLSEDPQEAYKRQNKGANYTKGDVATFFTSADPVDTMTQLMSQSNAIQRDSAEKNWDVGTNVLTKGDAESWRIKLDTSDEKDKANMVIMARDAAQKTGGYKLATQFFRDIDGTNKPGTYSQISYLSNKDTMIKALKGKEVVDNLLDYEKVSSENYFAEEMFSPTSVSNSALSKDIAGFQSGMSANMQNLKAYYKSRGEDKNDEDLFKEAHGVKDLHNRSKLVGLFRGDTSYARKVMKDIDDEKGKLGFAPYMPYSDKPAMWEGAYMDKNISDNMANNFQIDFFNYAVGTSKDGSSSAYDTPILPVKLGAAANTSERISPDNLKFINVPGSKTMFYAMYSEDGNLKQARIAPSESKTGNYEPYVVDINQMIGGKSW